MKILVTGFAPFGDVSVNPSMQLLPFLPARTERHEIVTAVLPVEFAGAGKSLAGYIRKYNPGAVVCIGQAGGRKSVSIERVAVNIMDASIPDNTGYKPTDVRISENGKNAYFSTLPIKKMARAVINAGFDACISNTAGTYVCNCTLYSLLEYAENDGGNIKGTFIHVPFSDEQCVGKYADMPFMTVNDMAKAISAALECL